MKLPGLLLLALLAAGAGFAQERREVGLELVLLADGSGSIDDGELAFQRQGYAMALTDPEVVAAIEDSLYGTIAVTYVEWATNTAVVVGWTIISDHDSAAAFAEALLTPPRLAVGRNAIGGALLEGKRLIESNDIDAPRAVIDFSGDSIGNSSGPSIAAARAEVIAAGITINALPILRPEDGRRAGGNLEAEYATRIIGGPGAFMVTAESRATFAQTVRRKLVLEIAGPGHGAQDRRRAACCGG
ncbi:DUF1194 domain-containing protein [Limimaricola pyoseonensis]|uniref:VWFA domain-containing protein n=1 Tax=Limimaricola pyoseonensis TaxID=521013 RepID=A0A1G7CDR3_9RHOB|nr:DUF1194 domain-containing protein [Limimaricola pyoseonensis]SDE37512.1 Protein of unknown function [Limimaricola pyoseonensis]